MIGAWARDAIPPHPNPGADNDAAETAAYRAGWLGTAGVPTRNELLDERAKVVLLLTAGAGCGILKLLG